MTSYKNGQIPTSVMKTFGGKYGHPGFIDDLTAFTTEMRTLGYNVYVASGQDIYRDYAGQVYWKTYWTSRGLPLNAATPGYSNHGFGVAADISGVGGWGSTAHKTAERVAAKHSLSFTVPSEAWHLESTRYRPVNGLISITGGGNTVTGHTGSIKTKQAQLNFLGYGAGTVDGKAGTKFVAATKAFQAHKGLTQDGINGNNTGKALTAEVKYVQNRLKAHGYNPGTIDGIPGASTIKALKAFQKAKKLTQDGVAGHSTGEALGKTPAKKTTATLKVDGIWGVSTTKALQKRLKVAQDGKLGTNTYKALQRLLGVTADGIWGASSKRALQKRLRVAEDGIIGVNTIKALQRRLNAGSF